MKFNSKQQIRIDVISQYLSGEVQYFDACCALEVSERHFRRLVAGFRKNGIKSLFHGNCGKTPPNKTSEKITSAIVRLYRGRYLGLNLVHFREKLIENHRHELDRIPCYSTLRKIFIREGLILPNQTKSKRKAHPRRKRYEKEGLMVQMDGSHHRWIFGHQPFCLTAAIDDATGKILGAKFSPTETTFAAMDVVEQVLINYGRFQMLYSDKAGIYGGGKRVGYTNMNRAMRELEIIPIQANSPQAKGRVERLFKTLQDRLCNEMRLLGIRTIEQANEYLPRFIIKHNLRFSIPAEDRVSAFKELPKDANLNEVFTMRETRRVSSGELISYDGYKYVVSSNCKYSLMGKTVEIRRYRNGEIGMNLLDGTKVDFRPFEAERMAA